MARAAGIKNKPKARYVTMDQLNSVFKDSAKIPVDKAWADVLFPDDTDEDYLFEDDEPKLSVNVHKYQGDD